MQAIPLYNRAGRSLHTLVDDQDFAWANEYRWRLSNKGYAIRSFRVDGKEVVLCLHRELMQPPPGHVVDHIDHNRLQNTRDNLRVLTVQENLMNRRMFRNNTSGFKGVVFQNGKWHARIQKDERDIHLGHYNDLKTAALVYDCAAVMLYGQDIVYRNLPEQPFPPQISLYVAHHLARRQDECG